MESWQNNFDRSITVWQQYISLAPEATTGHIGLARVLYWQGKHEAALQALAIALKKEPNYADTLILQGDILLADGRTAQARQTYLQAQAIKGVDTELTQKISRAIAPTQWRLDTGIIADHYSRTRGTENSMYAQLSYKHTKNSTLYARIDRGYSFREVDYGLSAGGYFLPTPTLALHTEVGTTLDSANFKAKTTGFVNAEWLLNAYVQPLLGLKYAHYNTVGTATGSVKTITSGVRVNFAPASLELRYNTSDNIDKTKTHISQAKLTIEREGYTPYILYASGKEALPPLLVAKVDIIGVGSVFNINPLWSVRVDYSQEKRQFAYTHDALGVGMSYKF
jgi:YaiO family outer membrane protein